MRQIMTAKEGWQWVKAHFTRKWTVWIHLLAGFILAIICGWYPFPAIVGFASFGWFEWWQASVEGDEGHLDFWDGMFAFIVGLAVLWIMNLAGVV